MRWTSIIRKGLLYELETEKCNAKQSRTKARMYGSVKEKQSKEKVRQYLKRGGSIYMGVQRRAEQSKEKQSKAKRRQDIYGSAKKSRLCQSKLMQRRAEQSKEKQGRIYMGV